MEKKIDILIVDDNAELASSVQDILEAEGYSTAVALDGEASLAACRESSFQLAIVDIKLPDISGMDLTEKMTGLVSGVEYVIITGYASLNTAIKAAGQREIVAYLTKPLNMEQFLPLIRQVLFRRKAAEELRKTREFLDRVLNGMYEIVMVTTPDYKIVDANKCFIDFYGVGREEAIGATCYEITHGISQPCSESHCTCPLQMVVDTKSASEVEHIHKNRSGKDVIVEISSFPIFAPTGEIEYIVQVQRDITERKQAEEKIRHLNLVLLTIRNVNQLITKEGDRGGLLEGVCKNLTESRGYYSAWIALLDESGKLTEYAESGLGKGFLPMVERLKQGRLP
ncbi:MAG: response regulator, partial [Dehalococcoidia bacterium]|nr:response regulator [Dehalococcoidia bacterium]